jgi:hypothetical protein
MCYELINEKGANLAQILDDNQMSYSNMHEYAKFVHTGKYSEQLTDYQTGASSVTIRNPEDAKSDFDTLYKDKGIKMNWKLVPVEEQKPHIGWRQSINDDGSLSEIPINWHLINILQKIVDNRLVLSRRVSGSKIKRQWTLIPILHYHS